MAYARLLATHAHATAAGRLIQAQTRRSAQCAQTDFSIMGMANVRRVLWDAQNVLMEAGHAQPAQAD